MVPGLTAGINWKLFLGKDNKGRDYIIEQAGSLSVSDGEWKYIAPSKGAAYNKINEYGTGE